MPPPVTAEAIAALITELALLETDDPITPESDLITLGLDSMATMQLLLHLERTFHVSAPLAGISREHISTPRALAAWITQR